MSVDWVLCRVDNVLKEKRETDVVDEWNTGGGRVYVILGT